MNSENEFNMWDMALLGGCATILAGYLASMNLMFPEKPQMNAAFAVTAVAITFAVIAGVQSQHLSSD